MSPARPPCGRIEPTTSRSLELAGPGRSLVTGASGIVRTGTWLHVVSDDDHAIHSWRVGEGAAASTPFAEGELPGEHAERKAAKADIEALTVLVDGDGALLVGFGSGSTTRRRAGFVVPLDPLGAIAAQPTSFDASELYARFDRAGEPPNVEGAAQVGDRMALLLRSSVGRNRIATLDASAACTGVRAGNLGADALRSVVDCDLGELDGVPLGFTDAVAIGGRLWFSAAAEDTPNAYDDGPVVGSVVGVLDEQLRRVAARWDIVAPGEKVEGIAGMQREAGVELVLVTDGDDESRPSALLECTVPVPLGLGRLADLGIDLATSEYVRRFPWSTVVRATSADGASTWIKRCGDGMSFEPALQQVVEQVGSPLLVPAAWIEGRWIATAHVDGRLERGDERLVDAIRRMQAPLVDLQRRFVPHVDDALGVGTPTLQAADVAPLVERVLRLCERDRHLGDAPLGPRDAAALREAVPRFEAQLELFDTAGAPATIQHLDLHHGNVFDGADGPCAFDWGDARIGSPLLHVVSTTSLLAFVTDLDRHDPRIAAVADDYLACWPELQLDARVQVALDDPRLAALVRLDALAAALASGSDDELRPFAGWLRTLVRAVACDDPALARGVRLA